MAVLLARVWAGARLTCAAALPADATLPADVGRVLAGGLVEADEGGYRVDDDDDDSRLAGSAATAFRLCAAVVAARDAGGLTGRRLGESSRSGSAGGGALAVETRSAGLVEAFRRERVRCSDDMAVSQDDGRGWLDGGK